MATVKISELPEISHISVDTTQTIIPVVDIGTDETGKVTVQTLAEGLFAYEPLKVGVNQALLPNTIAQFSGNSEIFLQTNLQNLRPNGSADYVATADIGTNANNYIDTGINNSNYNDPSYSAMKKLDGYLYTMGSLSNSADGNLIIGTASAGANVLFIAGGTREANVVARITRFGITLNNQSRLEFSDGTTQTTASISTAFSRAAANTANSASANTIILQGINTTQNTRLNSIETINSNQNTTITQVNQFAAGAYTTANGVNGLAAGAFNTANGANGLASGAFIKANNAIANTFAITVNNSVYIPGTLVVDGIVYANGATYVANAMSIPTTYSSPQTAITLNYQQANIVKTNITSNLVVSHTGIVLGKYIDLFVYNDSNATRTITHGVSANNASTKSLTSLVPPYSTKHLKYFTVNSDLANTYVIEAVSENYNASNVTFVGAISVNNSTFNSNSALVKITGSDNFVTAPASNANYMLHITGKANSVTRVVLDSFGANTYPLIAGRMGRGSAAAPAAVSNNDVLMRIAGQGYTGTQFVPSSPTKIDFVAGENFSNTNRGTRIEFWNTPNASNTIQKIASFNANTAEFIGTINPQKGFVFNPRLPVGDQTAITIDFGTDSIIKANLTADLNVTLSNYQFGKIVELWLVNTGAQNRTVTHGCTALNSTSKSTTYTITSGSSAYLRYFSINGDNANTFVSIIP